MSDLSVTVCLKKGKDSAALQKLLPVSLYPAAPALCSVTAQPGVKHGACACLRDRARLQDGLHGWRRISKGEVVLDILTFFSNLVAMQHSFQLTILHLAPSFAFVKVIHIVQYQYSLTLRLNTNVDF